jgi:hypothetical protein
MEHIRRWTITLLPLIFLLTALCGVSAIPLLVYRIKRPSIEEATDPLDATTVRDLCESLDMPEHAPQCEPGASVYATDFVQAVRASFPPGQATYADVHARIGRYEYELEDPLTMSDGEKTFRAQYDFKGDRVFRIGFVFSADGTLRRILASPYDSWP